MPLIPWLVGLAGSILSRLGMSGLATAAVSWMVAKKAALIALLITTGQELIGLNDQIRSYIDQLVSQLHPAAYGVLCNLGVFQVVDIFFYGLSFAFWWWVTRAVIRL